MQSTPNFAPSYENHFVPAYNMHVENQVLRMESNMDISNEIERRVAEELRKRSVDAEVEKRLEAIAAFGEDIFGDGTIMRFDKQFTEGGTKYSYAAIKANGLWYSTGPKTPKGYIWLEFIHWLTAGVPLRPEDVAILEFELDQVKSLPLGDNLFMTSGELVEIRREAYKEGYNDALNGIHKGQPVPALDVKDYHPDVKDMLQNVKDILQDDTSSDKDSGLTDVPGVPLPSPSTNSEGAPPDYED